MNNESTYRRRAPLLARQATKRLVARCGGFTLIELVIAVAVVAILATLAYQSYAGYVQRGRRIDAKHALPAVQLAQERHRANNPSYTTDLTSAGLNLGSASPDRHYTITITNAGATTYTATATATGAQARDTDCPRLTATERGFVVDATAACWGLR